MNITNNYNLPKSIVRAVKNHEHKSAQYSVTELLKPPRILHLERRHQDEISEDVSERIWALFGTAVHSIAQAGEGSQDLSEEYMESVIGGVTISGTSDLYDSETKTLWDFKNTSVWTIIYNSRIEEWTEQLNSYALLMTEQGFEVKHLKILAFLRDWQKMKASTDASYPQLQVVVVDIALNPIKDTKSFLEGRVKLMEANKDISDNDLPFCTDEQRWKAPDKYAVIKSGNVRAKRVLENPFEAQKLAESLGPDHKVKHRPGTPKRCMEYCKVAQFCNQFQMEKGNYEDN